MKIQFHIPSVHRLKSFLIASLILFAGMSTFVDSAHAHENTELRIWSLLKKGSFIVEGTVVDTRPSSIGLWHRVKVNNWIWGEKKPKEFEIFVHGQGYSETANLVPGESYMFGGDWLLPEKGSFHQKLLAESKNNLPQGIASPDSFLLISDPGRELSSGQPSAQLGREVDEISQSLLVLSRGYEWDKPLSQEELDQLLDELYSHWDFIREGVLRILLKRDLTSYDPSWRTTVREAFATEIEKAEEASNPTLQAYLDLIRNKGFQGCNKDICKLALTGENVVITHEATQTLAQLANDETIEELENMYPDSDVQQKVRILKILARAQHPNTLKWTTDLLNLDDPQLTADLAPILGWVKEQKAADLLEQLSTKPNPLIQRAALRSLKRQNTEWSRRALLNLRNKKEVHNSVPNLWRIRQKMSKRNRSLNGN